MKRLRSLRLISIVLLCWLFTPVIGVTAQKTAAPTAVTIPDAYKHSLPIAGDTGIVGSETCALCHADVAKKFGNNQHAELARLHDGKGVTCESCHGPGQAHVDSGGDKTKIFDFNTAPVKVVNAKCMSCHAGTHANFDRSAHGLAGIGCTSCHSNHAATSPEHLLKVAEPALCMGRHSDVKASFAQPFHHKVNEGVLNCTTCHNPHGTFQDKMLKTAADQNMVCVKCHAETHGPFVYEHPPIKTEGCVSCHTPHGSQNPRLLIKSNVNSLCIGCHTASANFSAPGTPSFHNVANQYQSCTSCHTQIHGSNASPYFFK